MFSKNEVRARGIVQNPIGSKGFGFIRIDGSLDVFTRQEVIVDSGFALADFKAGVEVYFGYEELKGNRARTLRVLELGGKLSSKVYTEKVVDRTDTHIIKKVMEIGREKYALGYRVYALDVNGVLKVQCVAATLAEGREIIGKVLEAPKPVNFGIATNVPRPNKGPTGQKNGPSTKPAKGQKKAA